jgi:hypothetical protein
VLQGRECVDFSVCVCKSPTQDHEPHAPSNQNQKEKKKVPHNKCKITTICM